MELVHVVCVVAENSFFGIVWKLGVQDQVSSLDPIINKEFRCNLLLSCIASVLSVFSSIVRDFLELFYNLWRTVLAKNKIVLDPALRLQSFRTPENATIGVRVGLNANNKSDGGPVPDSSRKN
ncbi:hypothetical protein TNCV_3938891 [Trichonephila clavipes]|nr:hypothetical protein TNCV_3938891 [Trichonephila clavipes]